MRPLHRNDQGALYTDEDIRPVAGHDPRDTVGQCPACADEARLNDLAYRECSNLDRCDVYRGRCTYDDCPFGPYAVTEVGGHELL